MSFLSYLFGFGGLLLIASLAHIPKAAAAVLVVEDNPGDLTMIRRMLSGSGRFEIISTGSLAAALHQLRFGADVVLLDLDLPDSRGAETVRAVRDAYPDVPIIVLTGNSEAARAQEALHAGADDYFVKGDAKEDDITQAIVNRLHPRNSDTHL